MEADAAADAAASEENDEDTKTDERTIPQRGDGGILGASRSDDSAPTLLSSSSILKGSSPRKMSDDGAGSSCSGDGGGASAESTESSAPRRRLRRLAFGRVTTHPFDAAEPASLRFDHEATVSEASADRWASLFGPTPLPSAPAPQRRRLHWRGRAAADPTAGTVGTDPICLLESRHGARCAEGRPRSPRRTGSASALLEILDEVSFLAGPPPRPSQKPPSSQGSVDADAGDALLPGPPLDGIDAAAPPRLPAPPGRRRRGIEPLPAAASDPLRAASASGSSSSSSSLDDQEDEEDGVHALESDEPYRGARMEYWPGRADDDDDDDDDAEQPRGRQKGRAQSLLVGIRQRQQEGAADPPSRGGGNNNNSNKASRVAPSRQVGRRGSALRAFLFLRDHPPRAAARGHGAADVEASPIHSQRRDDHHPAGPNTSDMDPSGNPSLLVPIVMDVGKVQESSGSTQESDSEDDDVAELASGVRAESSPPLLQFHSPLLRRRAGVRSSARHAIPSAPTDPEEGEEGSPRKNRSSMVTNLPSRTFSLAPANPCYRSKDGLQATHRRRSPGTKTSSFRRWTLVSILPSRKSRSSPCLVSR